MLIGPVPEQRSEFSDRTSSELAGDRLAGPVDRAACPDDLQQEPTQAAGQRHDQMTEDLTHGPGVTQAARLKLVLVEAIEEVSQQTAVGRRPGMYVHQVIMDRPRRRLVDGMRSLIGRSDRRYASG